MREHVSEYCGHIVQVVHQLRGEEVREHVSEYCGHIVQVVHQLRGGGR